MTFGKLNRITTMNECMMVGRVGGVVVVVVGGISYLKIRQLCPRMSDLIGPQNQRGN